MSEENVEIVRGLFDALNRGDLDELRRATPPDFVLDYSRSRGLDAGVFRGADTIMSLWTNLLEAWSEFEFYETEMIDAGDLVVRVGGVRGIGKGSGVEARAQGATLWRFEDGEPVSVTLFQSRREALEAAGLSE